MPRVEDLKIQLEDLEQSIEQLQFQLDTLTRERDRVRSQLHHQFNAAAPVSRLPVETLSQIFNHYISGRSMYHGRRLLLVCRRWYEVAIADPTLWTDVRLNLDYAEKDGLLEESLRFIDACYKRSGSLGLYITLDMSNLGKCSWEDDDAYHPKQGANVAWLLLSDLLKRDMSLWKSFYLWWPSSCDVKFFCDGFNPTILNDTLQRATQVEHVTINNLCEEFETGLVLHPIASRLTSLALYNATWDLGQFPEVQFPCMKRLYIEKIGDSDWSMSVDAINATWLDPFPRLEELTLSNAMYTDFENYESEAHTSLRIPAPSLKRLCLIGRLPRKLLAALQLPALETLQVLGNEDIEEPSDSIKSVKELSLAKDIKTLILQEIPLLGGDDSRLIDLILSFNRLATVTIDENILNRMVWIIDIKEIPTQLDGKTAYQLDIPTLKESLKSYRPNRSPF